MNSFKLQKNLALVLVHAFLILNSASLHAAVKGVSAKVKELLASGERPKSHKIFGESRNHFVDKAQGKAFGIDKKALAALKSSSSKLVSLSVPSSEGPIALILYPQEIVSKDFKLSLVKGKAQIALPKCFRGVVSDSLDNIASVCVDGSTISGVIKQGEKVVELSRLQSGEGFSFEVTQLQNPAELPEENDALVVPASAGLTSVNTSSGSSVSPTAQSNTPIQGVAARPVRVYIEADYDLFVRNGSNAQNTANYIVSFFNQVSTLYANENIAVEISAIKIWDTVDPFANQTNISNILNAFQSSIGTNWSGDLAHFITGRNVGGGIAYVDVLQFKSYAVAVSYVTTSYATVPTYSWTIEVFTHEMGHNLGSNHTQSCSWVGGALDNCVAPEGSCQPGPAPIGGGTIMSYCHISSYGINFTKGFGPQPGDKIRSRVVAALGANPYNPNGSNPPVVNAGADQNLSYTATSATLVGQASDPDGQIVSYAWSQIGGPGAVLSGINSSTLNVSNLASGNIYTFRLTATDNEGLSASDDVRISVGSAPVPKAPVVSAGADKSLTLPNNAIVLNGSASDSDGTIVSVAWTQISGPSAAVLSGESSLSLSVSGLVAGNYTFRLSATDNSGLSSFDDVVVKVVAKKGKGKPTR